MTYGKRSSNFPLGIKRRQVSAHTSVDTSTETNTHLSMFNRPTLKLNPQPIHTLAVEASLKSPQTIYFNELFASVPTARFY